MNSACYESCLCSCCLGYRSQSCLLCCAGLSRPLDIYAISWSTLHPTLLGSTDITLKEGKFHCIYPFCMNTADCSACFPTPAFLKSASVGFSRSLKTYRHLFPSLSPSLSVSLPIFLGKDNVIYNTYLYSIWKNTCFFREMSWDIFKTTQISEIWDYFALLEVQTHSSPYREIATMKWLILWIILLMLKYDLCFG